MEELVTIKVRRETRANLKYLTGMLGKNMLEVADELVKREIEKQNKRLVKELTKSK